VDTTWMHFPFLIADGIERNDMQRFFLDRGIPTRMVFSGNILRQPAFSKIRRREPSGGLPGSDRVMDHAVALPTHHGLSSDDIDHVAEVLSDWLAS
jgi:CDP-6-deoxy-D-xylo-4-hexulose-3-dehydrase